MLRPVAEEAFGQPEGLLRRRHRVVRRSAVLPRDRVQQRRRDRRLVVLPVPGEEELEGLVRASVRVVVAALVDRQVSLALERMPEVVGERGRDRPELGDELVELSADLVGLAGAAPSLGEPNAQPERHRIARPQRRRGLAHRLGQRRLRRVEVLETDQAGSDHPEQLHAQLGPHLCASVDPVLRLFQQTDRGEAVAALFIRIGVAEDGDDELLHALGALLLRHRGPGLPDRQARAAEGRDSDQRSRAEGQAIPSDELLQPIDSAVGLRQDRAAAQVALEVVGERVHGGVALGGALLERLEQDGVEVPSERAPRGGIGRHLARLGRLGVQDRLLEGAGGLAVGAVGPRAGEELEEHHGQRIHVRAEPNRAVRDLLGRRVRHGQRSPGETGDGALALVILVQDLGDAEVEEAHLSRLRDQHVRRLEIAVHDQLRVRVRDRLRDLEEQDQPRPRIERARAHVRVERDPLDILEREIRLSVIGHARVEDLGDVRMAQRGEDRPLALDPRRQLRSRP